MVVMNIRSAITAESTLSFLGIGLPIEVVSWGSMLSLSEKALLTDAWWIIVIPGCVPCGNAAVHHGAGQRHAPLDPRTHAIKQNWTIGCRRWSQSFYFCSGKSRTMGLRRRCLLGALFARAGAGTDLPAVEQDMNVKFLAVVRASLRDELIAQLLRFFALHELLQLRLIIVGLFRLGELRQDEPRHDVAGHGQGLRPDSWQPQRPP